MSSDITLMYSTPFVTAKFTVNYTIRVVCKIQRISAYLKLHPDLSVICISIYPCGHLLLMLAHHIYHCTIPHLIDISCYATAYMQTQCPLLQRICFRVMPTIASKKNPYTCTCLQLNHAHHWENYQVQHMVDVPWTSNIVVHIWNSSHALWQKHIWHHLIFCLEMEWVITFSQNDHHKWILKTCKYVYIVDIKLMHLFAYRMQNRLILVFWWPSWQPPWQPSGIIVAIVHSITKLSSYMNSVALKT